MSLISLTSKAIAWPGALTLSSRSNISMHMGKMRAQAGSSVEMGRCPGGCPALRCTGAPGLEHCSSLPVAAASSVLHGLPREEAPSWAACGCSSWGGEGLEFRATVVNFHRRCGAAVLRVGYMAEGDLMGILGAPPRCWGGRAQQGHWAGLNCVLAMAGAAVDTIRIGVPRSVHARYWEFFFVGLRLLMLCG
jgi:hypothetical protein